MSLRAPNSPPGNAVVLTENDDRSWEPDTKAARILHGIRGPSHKPSRQKLKKRESNKFANRGDVPVLRLPDFEGPTLRSALDLQEESGGSMTSMARGETGRKELYGPPPGDATKKVDRLRGFCTLRNDLAAHEVAAVELPPAPRSPWLHGEKKAEHNDALRSQSSFVEPNWHAPSSTSASSVKSSDHRRGTPVASTPVVHEAASEPLLKPSPSSALKQSRSTVDVGTHQATEVSINPVHKKSFFSKPQLSASRLFSPSRFLNSPTEITDGLDFFPQHTTHAELKRRTGTGRLEVFATEGRTSSFDSGSTATIRAKVFDKDIFDSTKRTVRRPPKGIQNWFDAVDVSSDEADGDDGQRAPTTKQASETLSNTNIPEKVAKGKANVTVRHEPAERASMDSAISPRTVAAKPAAVVRKYGDRTLPLQARALGDRRIPAQQLAPKTRARLAKPYEYRAAVADETVRGQQRYETSQTQPKFAVQSMLSLSDSEDNQETETAGIQKSMDSIVDFDNHGKPLGELPGNPSIPQRQIQRAASQPRLGDNLRRSQTSPVPSKRRSRNSLDRKLSPSFAGTSRYGESSDIAGSARRASSSASRQKARHRRLTGSSNQTAFEDLRSLAGATSVSSAPSRMSEADRLMAVTEEEMMLLELMRQKRGATQDSAAPEALDARVWEALAQLKIRRASGQHSDAGLRRRQSSTAISWPRHSAHPSLTSSSFSGPGWRESRTFSLDSRDLSADQLRVLGAIRREELDNARRIERFLRQQSPVDEQYPTSLPESMLMRTNRSSERDSTLSSQFEEALAQAGLKSSPIQHLTQGLTDAGPIRDSISTTFEEMDGDDPKLKAYTDAQRVVIGAKRMQRLFESQAEHKQEPTPEFDADVETNDEADQDDMAIGDSTVGDLETILSPVSPPPGRHSSSFEDRMRPSNRMSLLNTLVLEEEPVPDTRRRSSGVGFKPTRLKQSRSSPGPAIAPPVAPEATSLGSNQRNPSPPPRRSSRKGVELLGSWRGQEQDSTGSDYPGLVRPGSPSESTNRASPLTPQSLPAKPAMSLSKLGRTAALSIEEPYHSSSSQASLPTLTKSRGHGRRGQPARTELNLSESSHARVTSISSITSASEDVLAAWAELGGGSDAFTTRRPIGTRAGQGESYRGF